MRNEDPFRTSGPRRLRMNRRGPGPGERATERWRLAFLGLLVLELFVFPPLLSAGVLSLYVGSVIVSLTLVAGALAVGTRKSFRRFGASVAAVSLGAHWLHRWLPRASLGLADEVLSLFALGTFTVLMVAYALSDDRNIDYRLIGAVVGFLLIGAVWARAYLLLLRFYPDAIVLPGGRADRSDVIYYSFATLTTLGQGAAIHPVARSLATFEALVGMLFPAVFIARLLSRGGKQSGVPRE